MTHQQTINALPRFSVVTVEPPSNGWFQPYIPGEKLGNNDHPIDILLHEYGKKDEKAPTVVAISSLTFNGHVFAPFANYMANNGFKVIVANLPNRLDPLYHTHPYDKKVSLSNPRNPERFKFKNKLSLNVENYSHIFKEVLLKKNLTNVDAIGDSLGAYTIARALVDIMAKPELRGLVGSFNAGDISHNFRLDAQKRILSGLELAFENDNPNVLKEALREKLSYFGVAADDKKVNYMAKTHIFNKSDIAVFNFTPEIADVYLKQWQTNEVKNSHDVKILYLEQFMQVNRNQIPVLLRWGANSDVLKENDVKELAGLDHYDMSDSSKWKNRGNSAIIQGPNATVIKYIKSETGESIGHLPPLYGQAAADAANFIFARRLRKDVGTVDDRIQKEIGNGHSNGNGNGKIDTIDQRIINRVLNTNSSDAQRQLKAISTLTDKVMKSLVHGRGIH